MQGKRDSAQPQTITALILLIPVKRAVIEDSHEPRLKVKDESDVLEWI